MNKTYEFICTLPVQAASERIQRLLSKEGVEYRAANFSIASTRTPIVVFSFQPKLYSHSNWVGINPFVYISGVDVRFKAGDNGITKVTVCVDRRRAVLIAAIGIVSGLLAACAMPEPAGVLFLIGFTCAVWLGVVSFVGGYLIKKEISDYLKNQ